MRIPNKCLAKLVRARRKIYPKDKPAKHIERVILNIGKGLGKNKIENQQINQRMQKTPYKTK